MEDELPLSELQRKILERRKPIAVEAPYSKWFTSGFLETARSGSQRIVLCNKQNWCIDLEVERYEESIRRGYAISLAEWHQYLDHKRKGTWVTQLNTGSTNSPATPATGFWSGVVNKLRHWAKRSSPKKS